MTTATMSTPTTAPTPVPTIPFAPAGLLEWQARQIARSGELATAKALRLIARGTCRVAGHVGAPVYVVSSASRPGSSHIVWIERGRIHCDCAARIEWRAFTCSHAQFVRLLIVAELAEPRSAPPAARLSAVHVEPKPAPTPEPEPEPPTPTTPTPRPRRKRAATPEKPSAPAGGPAGGPSDHDRQPCPNCGALTDAAELAELGECLNCLQMRADFDRAEADAADARAVERETEQWAQDEAERMAEELAQRLPCWCCGAPATAETDHGLYCDECVTKPAAQQRREARARLAAEKVANTRAAVEARQEARAAAKAETARRYTPQEQEAARRDIARDRARTRARTATTPRATPRAGDDDFGTYDRRPFSMWKSETNREQGR